MASFRNASNYGKENPCSGCAAPCCRCQVHSYNAPGKFKDLDQALYRLGVPGSELVVGSNGDWMLVYWLTCALFDEDSCSCSVHGTPAQPKVCVYYDPYDCWFRRSFVGAAPETVVRMNRARFEKWMKAVEIDVQGGIVELPTFEDSRRLVADLPIEPVFREGPLVGEVAPRLERKEM